MKSQDQNLIIEFKKGSKKAFESIYNSHYISIFFFAKRFVANSQDAEDITTDTFMKLWNMRNNFENMEGILGFLHVSVKNACLNYLRNEKRQATTRNELFYLLSNEVEQPWEDDITAAVYKYIVDQIEQLPGQMKKVFKMAYIEGLSNEEIAQALDINNQSVRNHKARALKILRLSIPAKDILELILILLPLFRV